MISHDLSNNESPNHPAVEPRLVVAHFMLGNTYPFTENDWKDTFALAEETNLDGLALNLGPEEWQINQARTAFRLLETTNSSERLKLFFSLDMNVLPSSSIADATQITEKIADLLNSPAYLLYQGRPLLSTFGGHQCDFGGIGWEGFLDRLCTPVFFMPAFFMPPEEILALPYVDGTFAWNNAWPMGDHPIDLDEDQPFLHSDKPYMAAVSPLFFTHYGTTPPWAWNKNFIYRSDDLLYPTRWSQLLNLPAHISPSIIQIISWNDYGESHAIAPVRGAQPGSEAWNDGMDHEGFREVTQWFSRAWKGKGTGKQKEEEGAGLVVMWYRVHPAGIEVGEDEVGRPRNAEWARDLINLFIHLPTTPSKSKYRILLKSGSKTYERSIEPGKLHLLTVKFEVGPVTFVVYRDDRVCLRGEGRAIEGRVERYNFNMWSGVWRVDG